jgi:hypothetical protein
VTPLSSKRKRLTGRFPILSAVQTRDLFDESPELAPTGSRGRRRVDAGGVWSAGERIVWVSALVLMLSSLMGWYTGSDSGVQLAVIGWHTGTLGKLVFFIGFVVLAIAVLRAFGLVLPPSVPESLVVLALGALATVFVLIRIISIPDSMLPADARGIGIWISLVSALAVVCGGLIRASEEL